METQDLEQQIRYIKLSRDHYKSEYEKLINEGQLWNKDLEAAKVPRFFIGLTEDNEVHKLHFAQDLSGEEQPAFSGFFRKIGDSYSEVKIKAWMPYPGDIK